MAPKSTVNLPYFDCLLQELAQNNADMQLAFGRHVHWGYWEDPKSADSSIEDFAQAAERLTRQVCDAAQINQGDRILDVGCGFGGAIASLNERFAPLTLVGLNLDNRQLARAREQVKPNPGNHIEFVEGNACQLPFPDNSFDVVLAIECIFHFPSRQCFFQEAQRVLRPGGKLALSDFVLAPRVYPWIRLLSILAPDRVSLTYGPINTNFTLQKYHQLSQEKNLVITKTQNITEQTLPTYPIVKKLFRDAGNQNAETATAIVQMISQWKILRYLILGFELTEKNI